MKFQTGKEPRTRVLSDVERYLNSLKDVRLSDKAPEFESILRHLRRFIAVDENTRILEVGTGIGWFPILCKKNGLHCHGMEISEQLVRYAHEFGRRNGVEPDVAPGNIEEDDIGCGLYDVVIAKDVFEHVRKWQLGIRRIYNAMRPQGVFYFTSTNKFSIFRSGEHNFPLYGWLPDRWRYRLRISRQGPDIMKLGIDFNQFTYGQLRRFFWTVGFSRVLDRIDCIGDRNAGTRWRRLAVILARSWPVKHVVLLHCSHTAFTCVK